MNRMTYRGGQGSMGTIPGGPLGEARYALASGQYDKAERIARKRLERNPGDTSARVVLAQALLQQQLIDDAITEARRAIREQNTNADAHMLLSSALIQRTGAMRRVSDEAVESAKRAVQLQPRSARTHVQLAEVYLAKQDLINARAEADEAIRLEPRLAGAHLMRAIVLLTDKDPGGAVQASDAALRNDRTLTQADLIKANAYLDLKQYDNALTSLDSVERQNPMLAGTQTQVLRGRVYFKQRKIKRSYETFLQLQRMNSRMRFLAVPIAAVNTFFIGMFGQSGQYAWLALMALLVVLVLFLLSLIPVVGGWIVAVLALALVGFLAFSAVRQTQGRWLPAAPNARFLALGSAVIAGVAGLALALFLIGFFSRNVFHTAKAWQPDPVSVGVAGSIGLALAATAFYFMGKYVGRQSGATAVQR